MNINQRKSEWNHFDDLTFNYHLSQWETPKRSTVFFEKYINEYLLKSKNIIDLGCGAGAATSYIAQKNSHINIVGMDCSEALISHAKDLAEKHSIPNINFEIQDWFNLPKIKNVDGVISLQTLSWLPTCDQPLIQIFEKIAPKWIGLTSLFYEGDISCRIEVEEHKRNNKKSFYNIYSKDSINRLCRDFQYEIKHFIPFEIDIDIQKPENKDMMSTYTEKIVTENDGECKRIQISGPLMMSWYIVILEKI